MNAFIDQEIENLPLSFKRCVTMWQTTTHSILSRNFQNVHGIHPILLTFTKAKKPHSSQSQAWEQDDVDGAGRPLSFWSLEKAFLRMSDDFFLFYLFFALILTVVIGVIKTVFVPLFWSMSVTLAALGLCLAVILASIAYIMCCWDDRKRGTRSGLSVVRRNIIWLVVAVLMLVCSVHDIIMVS